MPGARRSAIATGQEVSRRTVTTSLGEYARAGFDVRHRIMVGGNIVAPYGLTLSPLITASSGLPFNITAGNDLNGDSIFNDRPAWATDLSRPSVVRTPTARSTPRPSPGRPSFRAIWATGHTAGGSEPARRHGPSDSVKARPARPGGRAPASTTADRAARRAGRAARRSRRPRRRPWTRFQRPSLHVDLFCRGAQSAEYRKPGSAGRAI